ncbi:MAG TPA: 50S ribosomal protein L2 [Candidatus Babeliales bacterium]|jgi:large subunit ribosomal protein L2|nr:50S ribosomal protein L2 [Candidatus Babeliales bacterium]
MPIVRRRPRNSSLRFQSFISSEEITRKKPERSLVTSLKSTGGRNSYGRITVRHREGGAARKYRIIDFARQERDVPGILMSIEYDPNRNVRIGLIGYANGAKRYILLPQGLSVGDTVIASEKIDAKIGNCLPLENIPVGFIVHNVGIKPELAGVFARSAGTSVEVVAKNETHVSLKMPSNEIRMVSKRCWATVGVLGNADYKNINWGKAGRTRYRGFRPSVRGMAMNPVDHPHGGGEGRSKSGSHPTTPWGKGCKGTRTRPRRKNSSLIVKRRK